MAWRIGVSLDQREEDLGQRCLPVLFECFDMTLALSFFFFLSLSFFLFQSTCQNEGQSEVCEEQVISRKPTRVRGVGWKKQNRK